MQVSSARLPPPRAGRRSRTGTTLLAVAIVAGLWFLTLDARHLLRSDEGRYAEIAREMWATGDWVTIRYQGLKYFEKPPLHLWITAAVYQAFGVGDWQARLWVAVSGAAGMLAIAWAARRWYGPRVALLTLLVLLAAPAWNIAAHFNSLDMSLSGALAGVLAGVLLAQHPLADAGSRRAWMAFAWACAGAAVLTKGLIGIVLPGLALVVYTLLARDGALWRRLHLVGGTLLMLAITAPWFVAVSLRNPEFPAFFFIHEHWQRYTSGVHQRGAPWWYFGPQLLLGFLPWAALLPRMARVVATDAPRENGLRPAWLLASWAGATFVFFSLSGSKLPGYIVPIYPALAVLAALALERIAPRSWRRGMTALLLLALLGLAASVGAGLAADAADPLRHYAPWLACACALIAAGAAQSWRRARGADALPAVVGCALALYLGTTVGLLGHETLGGPRSGAGLVPQIERVLAPGMPIYSVRLLDHTLPYYLRRTMIMVEQPDELAFGVAQEPQKWLPTLAAFGAAWTTGPRALAVMSPATRDELRARHWPLFEVAADPWRVVVGNFRPTPE